MKQPSVVVVEDEALIADDLERTLVRLGYEVPAVVADGKRAIEATLRCAPSLVLMDIKLRGSLDGIDAARAIKERVEVPIVFLTSHSDPATLSRASAVQPGGYVTKPFAERDLRVAIELALHKHEVERALRAKERWFSTTLHSIGDGVLATDEKLLVTFMNRVAESVTGWSQADATGRPVDEVFHLVDDAGAPVEGPAAQALATRALAHLPASMRLQRRDGTFVGIDDSAAPIIDGRGALIGIVVVFRDVTERRSLEARVARSERLASLGTLAAGICHEINNPLTSVLANVDYTLGAMDSLAVAEEVRESLTDAKDAAHQIGEIVREIREFARHRESHRAEVDLRDCLERAVKLTTGVMRPSASLERDYRAAPRVFADTTRLTQVFVNLLANAAQAIPPGDPGHHLVSVRLRTDADGHAVVEISDDGEGIPRAQLSRIFDPFFTTKGPGVGVGLGLSICLGIVEGAGGELSVDSTPGVGSTFRVRLPAAGRSLPGVGAPLAELADASDVPPPARSPLTPSEQLAVAAAERLRTGDAVRPRVLLIDDEALVSRALYRALSVSCDVDTCSDGTTALAQLLGPEWYDVILCDLVMPGTTGMQLFELVVSARPERAAHFIFMTGGAATPASKAFVERTDVVVLAKPLDIGEFLARTQRLLRANAPPKPS